jgi:hypothetical protein
VPAPEALATVFDDCGAVTVLEGCAGAETVGFAEGELTEEEALIDPTGV